MNDKRLTIEDIEMAYQAMLKEQEEMKEERHHIFDEVADLKERVDKQERLLHQLHAGEIGLCEYLEASGNKREDVIRSAAREHQETFHGDTREGRIASASFINGAKWADSRPVVDASGTEWVYQGGYKKAVNDALQWLKISIDNYCEDVDAIHSSAMIGDLKTYLERAIIKG